MKLVIVSRDLAARLRIPRTLYDVMAQMSDDLGIRLRDAMKGGIQGLW